MLKFFALKKFDFNISGDVKVPHLGKQGAVHSRHPDSFFNENKLRTHTSKVRYISHRRFLHNFPLGIYQMLMKC